MSAGGGFSRIQGATGLAGIDRDGNPVGDLTGSYPGPVVRGLQTYPIDPRDPSNGDTLVFNGGEWIPTPTPSNTAALFKGVWDADANDPDIANYPGLADGFTWLVQYAGNTDVGGITDWNVGDYAIYSGGNWYKLSNSSFGWGLTGNAGTTPTVNYVGTSDEHDLSLRTNAEEVLRLFYGKGAFLSGSLTVDTDVTVQGNITGSNATLSGDLKISGGDLAVTTTTFNLANTDATTVNAFGAATTVEIGAATGTTNVNNDLDVDGDLNIDGGDLTVSTATFNLANTTATTVNAFGAATTIEIGAATGTTNVNNNLDVDGDLNIDGGDLTVSTATFNLANTTASTINFGGGASTALNMGNTAGTNTVFGVTKFPQGLSGSLTKLTDGTSYITAGQNIAVASASNGAVNVAFSTPATASLDDVLVFNGTAWAPSSIINTLQTSYQTVRAQGNILAGDVCYIVNAGGSNAYPTVAKAQANAAATVKGVIGLATANIAANTTGSVQTYGQLPGPVDTNNFPQGAPLYVSPTVAGAVTDVKPAGPNYAFQIGFVTRQGQPQNVTTGIVFVSPIMQTDTQNLSDLVITSAAEHDVLTYDSATTTWKNKPDLWVPNTQTALAVDNNTIIGTADFLNVVYLPIKTQGGANKTLNATTPIVRLTKTSVDYGRELWLHNVDNNKSVTIPAGGSVLLDGGVNLVLVAGAIAKFVWTGIGGNGSWVQTSKALTAS